MSYDLNKWIANEQAMIKRRRWVPLYLGFMMLMIALLAVIETLDDGSETGWVADTTPAFMTWVVAMAASPFARATWFGGRAALSDEFERDALSRATRRAYGVMMLLLLAVFALLWVASIAGWPAPRTPMDWSSFGLAILGIGSVLPVFFAELMVPLPPRDDQEEE